MLDVEPHPTPLPAEIAPSSPFVADFVENGDITSQRSSVLPTASARFLLRGIGAFE
jgi:hypothetical protein